MIVISSNIFNNGHSSFTTIDLLYMVIIVIIVTPSTMVNHASLKTSRSFWNNDRIGRSLKRSAKNDTFSDFLLSPDTSSATPAPNWLAALSDPLDASLDPF